MNREYIADLTYTRNQLQEIVDGLQSLLAQPSQQSAYQVIIGGLIAGLSYWVTAPIAIAIASIIAQCALILIWLIVVRQEP